MSWPNNLELQFWLDENLEKNQKIIYACGYFFFVHQFSHFWREGSALEWAVIYLLLFNGGWVKKVWIDRKYSHTIFSNLEHILLY